MVNIDRTVPAAINNTNKASSDAIQDPHNVAAMRAPSPFPQKSASPDPSPDPSTSIGPPEGGKHGHSE